LVGALGTVACGETEVEAEEGEELPAVEVATTLKVYAVPLVRPLIVQVVAGALTMQVRPPGEAVTV
jgi:hypothetical protein